MAGHEPTAPEPMGFFKSPYYDGGSYQVFVRFFALWPVGAVPSGDPNEMLHVLANGNLHGKDVPVILDRQVGKGHVILIGDTSFAMNKNLETEEGEAFDGAHENSDFCRWLIPHVTGDTPWIPKPPPAPAPATAPRAGDSRAAIADHGTDHGACNRTGRGTGHATGHSIYATHRSRRTIASGIR